MGTIFGPLLAKAIRVIKIRYKNPRVIHTYSTGTRLSRFVFAENITFFIKLCFSLRINLLYLLCANKFPKYFITNSEITQS